MFKLRSIPERSEFLNEVWSILKQTSIKHWIYYGNRLSYIAEKTNINKIYNISSFNF